MRIREIAQARVRYGYRKRRTPDFEEPANSASYAASRTESAYCVITEALFYMDAVAQSQTQVTKKQLRALFALYESPVINGSPFLQVLTLRIIGRVADLSNLNKFVGEMGYLTASGRRELLTVAFERQTLAEWVNAQKNSNDLTEWEQSALRRLLH
jgi:hypothetical protein